MQNGESWIHAGRSTAPFPPELAAFPGLERVPRGAEREVLRFHDGGEGNPHPPEEILAEEAVLVEHGDDELLGDVANEEAELLIPHGAEAPIHHGGGPGAAVPQLQPHVEVAGAVEVDRREPPRLDHMHAQQHRRVPAAGLHRPSAHHLRRHGTSAATLGNERWNNGGFVAPSNWGFGRTRRRLNLWGVSLVPLFPLLRFA
jgi:hypothetical protein